MDVRPIQRAWDPTAPFKTGGDELRMLMSHKALASHVKTFPWGIWDIVSLNLYYPFTFENRPCTTGKHVNKIYLNIMLQNKIYIST